MINVTFTFKQNIFLFGLYILVNCILGLIVHYIIGLLVRVLVVWLTLTYPNSPSLYVQIETFDSLNWFDQSMIRIMLLKIETLVFLQHKTLTKENQATIE